MKRGFDMYGSEIYEEKTKGKKLPMWLIEELKRKANEEEYKTGWGTKCEKCGAKTGQSDMRLVILGNFRNGHVCSSCKRKYGLQDA